MFRDFALRIRYWFSLTRTRLIAQGSLQQSLSRFFKPLRKLKKWLSLLTFAAVATYTWLTYLQMGETQQQLALARQQSKLQLRAKVDVQPRVHFQAGQEPQIAFVVRNTGDSPVVRLTVFGDMGIADSVSPVGIYNQKFRFQFLGRLIEELPTNASIPTEADLLYKVQPVTETEVGKMESGLPFVVHGGIDYADAAGNVFDQIYCFYIIWEKDVARNASKNTEGFCGVFLDPKLSRNGAVLSI